MRLLLVEDESALAEGMAAVLKKSGYDVDVSDNGEEGLGYALNGVYDAILLDIMLPGKDGLEILRELRRLKKTTPVMLITARSATEDVVAGLDAGADDYLRKPFEKNELLARVRALLRRHGQVLLTEELSYGDLVLDSGYQTLRCRDQAIRLRGKEHSLMETLMQASGKIVPKESLYAKVWGLDAENEYNNVEVYISFLRKKLANLDSVVRIRSIRNQGYCLEAEND